MIRISVRDDREIFPFLERARDLRIQNKPLWLHQNSVLAPYTQNELYVRRLSEIYQPDFIRMEDVRECLVFRENLFFDEFFIRDFIDTARERAVPCRLAFAPTDPAFREHALPLSNSFTPAGGLYVADLWYFPNGPTESGVEPLIMDMQAREIGFYHVPTYMASQSGDLTFQVPLRAFIAIDSWVHVFIADMVFGLFARGARFEKRLNQDLLFKLKIVASALYEGKQVLETRPLVTVGKNCSIDPTAVIHGPTTIGDNVVINAGAVVENCIIGDNVNISQGCQLMLSVVGDGTFLPFRASMFMTTMMDNSMVAQNTCLQMCVIGRNTFVGAGSTFTDYNLVPSPILALVGEDKLTESKRPVLGGCVGHNCRLGAGFIIAPARAIESDVVLVASDDFHVITKNVTFQQSHHHDMRAGFLHQTPYHGEKEQDSW